MALSDPPAVQAPLIFLDEGSSPLEIIVWASDPRRAEQLAAQVAGPGRTVHVLHDEKELARLGYRPSADLLVAEDDAALAAREGLLRLPLVLVRGAPGLEHPRLVQRAYATVSRPSELDLAIDRFIEHRRLAARAAATREPPRQCSRCGRGYNSLAARKGLARRFVRFGATSLCGGCVDALRRLLRQADSAFVDAEAVR